MNDFSLDDIEYLGIDEIKLKMNVSKISMKMIFTCSMLI